MGQIQGTKQVEVSITIEVPPGATPEDVGKTLSQGGLSVAAGLLQYVRSVKVDVQDVPGPKLV